VQQLRTALFMCRAQDVRKRASGFGYQVAVVLYLTNFLGELGVAEIASRRITRPAKGDGTNMFRFAR
jgi:hypothetical protein